MSVTSSESLRMVDWEIESQVPASDAASAWQWPAVPAYGSLLGFLLLLTFGIALAALILALTRKNNGGGGQTGPQGATGPQGVPGHDCHEDC